MNNFNTPSHNNEHKKKTTMLGAGALALGATALIGGDLPPQNKVFNDPSTFANKALEHNIENTKSPESMSHVSKQISEVFLDRLELNGLRNAFDDSLLKEVAKKQGFAVAKYLKDSPQYTLSLDSFMDMGADSDLASTLANIERNTLGVDSLATHTEYFFGNENRDDAKSLRDTLYNTDLNKGWEPNIPGVTSLDLDPTQFNLDFEAAFPELSQEELVPEQVETNENNPAQAESATTLDKNVSQPQENFPISPLLLIGGLVGAGSSLLSKKVRRSITNAYDDARSAVTRKYRDFKLSSMSTPQKERSAFKKLTENITLPNVKEWSLKLPQFKAWELPKLPKFEKAKQILTKRYDIPTPQFNVQLPSFNLFKEKKPSQSRERANSLYKDYQALSTEIEKLFDGPNGDYLYENDYDVKFLNLKNNIGAKYVDNDPDLGSEVDKLRSLYIEIININGVTNQEQVEAEEKYWQEQMNAFNSVTQRLQEMVDMYEHPDLTHQIIQDQYTAAHQAIMDGEPDFPSYLDRLEKILEVLIMDQPSHSNEQVVPQQSNDIIDMQENSADDQAEQYREPSEQEITINEQMDLLNQMERYTSELTTIDQSILHELVNKIRTTKTEVLNGSEDIENDLSLLNTVMQTLHDEHRLNVNSLQESGYVHPDSRLGKAVIQLQQLSALYRDMNANYTLTNAQKSGFETLIAKATQFAQTGDNRLFNSVTSLQQYYNSIIQK